MSQRALATTEQAETAAAIMERVILAGDLAKLTPEERVRYHDAVCASMGLNPLTRPFDYISLNGKLQLYAKKDATDQLRKINHISVSAPSVEYVGDMYVVTVTARDDTGRTDTDIGVVNVAGLKGDALANAMMKALTKSKRRVTLSIAGLGWLDETEIETIPSARQAPQFARELADHQGQKRQSAPVIREVPVSDFTVEPVFDADDYVDVAPHTPTPTDADGVILEPDTLANAEQIADIHEARKANGWTVDEVRALVTDWFQKPNLKSLTEREADQIIARLEQGDESPT